MFYKSIKDREMWFQKIIHTAKQPQLEWATLFWVGVPLGPTNLVLGCPFGSGQPCFICPFRSGLEWLEVKKV